MSSNQDNLGEAPELLALVAAAQAGDREIAGRLLAQYRPLLAAIVKRAAKHLQHNIMAEDDLWQEAFRHFLELLQGYRSESAVGFGEYLRQKLNWRLLNLVRDEVQRQSRFDRLEPKHYDAVRYHLSAGLGAGIENPRLRAAYQSLSPKQRNLINRLHAQNQAIGEIAAALGLTTQAVTALRRRAEERLRRGMEG